MKLPLPPFAKKLDDFIATGQKPKNDIFVFAGVDAWQKASALNQRMFCVCLPLNTNPKNYRWPVHGCSVLVFHTGSLSTQQIEKLVYCLFVYGALIVRVDHLHKHLFVFRKEAFV